MSTDYDCSRRRCEHERAAYELNEFADFHCEECEHCDWRYVATSRNGYMAPDFERCPKCEVGRVMKYGQPHVNPHRAQLTRALTAQAWGVACSLFEELQYSQQIAEGEYREGRLRGVEESIDGVAELPSPAELAAEILGEDT